MNDFQEKLKNSFINPSIFQGGRNALKIGKVNKLLGKKSNRKFLGRNRSGRNKSKSKRKNNFKTFDARKILSGRHGIINALKKNNNKYVLTYGDIARLMRKYGYAYNRDLKKWLSKEEKIKIKKEPEKKISHSSELNKKSHDTDDSDEESDDFDDNEDDDDSDDFSIPDSLNTPKPKNKEPEKDKLKITQARIILIANGEQNFGEYTIESDDIKFNTSDEEVFERMMEKEMLWLKNKDKWVDYKGKDPNPLEGYKGTLGRAILVENKEYSFLSFEEANLDIVSEKLEDLGYEWLDGTWSNTEETVTETHSPEYIDYYNRCRQEYGSCKVCGEPLTRVRSMYFTNICYNGHAWAGDERCPQYDKVTPNKIDEEAAGTSSTPANAGPGANTQGIAPFKARLGSKMNKRTFPETTVI